MFDFGCSTFLHKDEAADCHAFSLLQLLARQPRASNVCLLQRVHFPRHFLDLELFVSDLPHAVLQPAIAAPSEPQGAAVRRPWIRGGGRSIAGALPGPQ